MGGYAPPRARQIWREIELAGNQTLADLGEAIPEAFDFDEPHLWAFFLDGKPWDATTRSTPWTPSQTRSGAGSPDAAARVRIREAPAGTEFLFLFDFGDEWRFGVKLARTSDTVDPGARYPRIVARHGEPPLNTPTSRMTMRMLTPTRPILTEPPSNPTAVTGLPATSS